MFFCFAQFRPHCLYLLLKGGLGGTEYNRVFRNSISCSKLKIHVYFIKYARISFWLLQIFKFDDALEIRIS